MIDTQKKNYLSYDVVIKGSIKFANEFIFDGNLEGDITSADGVLTVGENANVRGDVKEVTPNNAAIKDVAVAQNREPQKIGARR